MVDIDAVSREACPQRCFALSLKGRIGRYEDLVRLIGPKLAAIVSARLAGKRITIGKKTRKIYVEYCRRKSYYDQMRLRLAAELLRCNVRYLKKLKALTNRIENEV